MTSTAETRGQPSESLQAMYDLVEALQQPLSELVHTAQEVHERLRPIAPQLLQANTEVPGAFWYTSSMNYYDGQPASDTLTINVGEKSRISIDKLSSPNLNEPIWMFTHKFPYDETRNQHTVVKVFHRDSKAHFPLDISESLYKKEAFIHAGFVGEPYEDQEPHIRKFMAELLELLT